MLENTLKRIIDFYSSLSFARKMALISILSGICIISTFLFVWAGKANYVNLISKLNSVDSTSVIRYLRERKIPFKVDEKAKAILVPHDHVYDLRLELASRGLAQTGVVGYEIFDDQAFGTTSTVQKINLQRALEGELVRTISHLRGVERARVHLAIPTKSAFIEEKKLPSASVVLDLLPGSSLSEEHIKGIQNLVAGAVEDLDNEKVVVLSTDGKRLSRNMDSPAAAFAAATLDYQRKIENKLEAKVVGLLERVVGEGRVMAKVSADFDFSKISETQTILDSDNATARSVVLNNDSMNGSRPAPGGQPGVQTQVPGAEGRTINESVVSNNTSRNREVKNFEIPQTRRLTQKPMASLQRLSVAVMLDGQYTTPEGEDAKPIFADWPPEKLAEFKSLVANVVGWQESRDPPIEIKTMKFYKEDLEASTIAAEKQERNRTIIVVVGWLGVGLIFSMFFIFVVRPFIKWVTENTVDNVEDFLPQTLDELERAQSGKSLPGMEELLPEIEERIDPEKIQGEMIREKILSLVNENPKKASQVLHEWIHMRRDDSAATTADDNKAG